MNKLIAALFMIFTVGCASISTGVDTVKNVVATAVDTTVSSAATMATAITEDVVDTGTFVVETGMDVVQSAADRIDQETDEIQPKKPTDKEEE